MSQFFRLYILGRLRVKADTHDITIVGEHNGGRAIEHVTLSKADIDDVGASISNVRNFIEFGTPPLASSDVLRLGLRLADTVLVHTIKGLLDGAIAFAEIMPLEIVVEDPLLSTWPWEYLYDKTSGAFVCEEFQPVSRSVFTTLRNRPAPAPPSKLRVLVLVGLDLEHSTAATEVKWIEGVFQAALDNTLADVKVVRVFDPDTFTEALEYNPHDVLHYLGHGDFDEQRQEAYLALQQRGGQVRPFYAQNLASAFVARNTRFVFLNACNTGKTSASEALVRSGLAPALLNKGVPAVLATQFVLPDVSAHNFAAKIYNSIARGKRLIDAVRSGRQTMRNGEETGFVDWGIPVLYARDSTLVLHPRPAEIHPTDRHDDRPMRVTGVEEKSALFEIARAKGKPSAIVERTIDQSLPTHRRRVALVDLDSKVAFLPDLAQKANQAQDYYHFAVAYLPFPSGSVRYDMDEDATPQLYLPRVRKVLEKAPKLLGVDMACCLTRNYLAGEGGFFNYLAAPLYPNSKVIAVSTAALPDLAKAAGVSFAKAVLFVSLSEMLLVEGHWPDLGYHPETFGCLFDFCELHEDLVTGLTKMRFDHAKCRRKITDPRQLAAIDALLETELTEQ